MNNKELDEILNGPFKVAFSSQGVEEFVAKNQKVKKHKFFDTSELFGFDFPKIPSKSLQKLFMTGSITRLEYVMDSFYQQRNGMMKLSRLFSYAALYRQFDTKLQEIFLRSDVLQQWNRNYPRLFITKETNTRSAAYTALIAKSQAGMLDLKQTTLSAIQQKILQNTKTIAEEKKEQILQTIRYLNAIDPVIWLLLVTNSDEYITKGLMQDIQKLLISYVEKSDFAEFMPLLLAELCIVIGNIQSMGLSAPMMGQASFHEKVMMSYEISVLKKSQEEKTKVKITLGNSESGFEAVKGRMDGAKDKSLDKFFEMGKDQEMSIMYLNYVKEACRKRDIFFDSFTSQIGNSKNTLVNLSLTL